MTKTQRWKINFEVLFSLDVALTPCKLSKTFFWIKLVSKTNLQDLQDFKDAFLECGF